MHGKYIAKAFGLTLELQKTFQMIEFLVRESSTIREALIKIEKTHKGYVFVVDKDDRVLGSLTDGDIRRALMAGGTLDCLVTSACNQNFVKASKHDSRNTVINHLKME